MTKLFLVDTNADTQVIELDHEYQIARVIATAEVQDWATAEDLAKVEDTSSWDVVEYEEVAAWIDSNEVEILATLDFE